MIHLKTQHFYGALSPMENPLKYQKIFFFIKETTTLKSLPHCLIRAYKFLT